MLQVEGQRSAQRSDFDVTFCKPIHLFACQHKQPGNKHTFCNFAIFIRRCLEGLTGRIGEAVEVETIIPIRAANEGKIVGSESVERVLDGTLQMLVERSLCPGLVFILEQLIQD